ncbi:uncharacterized protein LOC120705224 [Panicum virgatum]|uniref:uncharacterized protein LOC120705224 n=1 Tax=Panicum virgatum TaxID=38727 RepID=UPI0019D5C799|nr:uncharacterized protein LOC120705224 [Panicum virgatum]
MAAAIAAAELGLTAETPPLARFRPSRPRSELPLAVAQLPNPLTAAQGLQNTAAATQHRRRPQLAVELVVPPYFRPKQPRERLHLAPTEPPSPDTSAHGRRSAAAPEQTAASEHFPAPRDHPKVR